MSYVLQVALQVKPENVDAFVAKVRVNAAAARSEPGCRQFDVVVDPNDPTRMMLYEVYDDAKAYLAEAVPLLASRERHVWTRVDP